MFLFLFMFLFMFVYSCPTRSSTVQFCADSFTVRTPRQLVDYHSRLRVFMVGYVFCRGKYKHICLPFFGHLLPAASAGGSSLGMANTE